MVLIFQRHRLTRTHISRTTPVPVTTRMRLRPTRLLPTPPTQCKRQAGTQTLPRLCTPRFRPAPIRITDMGQAMDKDVQCL
ncbi:hypothetical protein DPMN_187695 [Dreissena polymorpha]|uniref:Uncharacterized protein n=1 Tax=Dreissena polymorpha TaxID=45954 RepID=A0A9D4DRK5_DREPO|nr:hypothetical protein DPMN_187695 [Dreissena polymorpha]